jgi:hypothetical protein
MTALACAALLLALASTANAATRTHGKLLHITKPGVGLNAAQSNNWFGYNQGTLEQGGKLFNSITGDWTVPTATQHTSGQDEASSDWIGIGGGCIDANCTVGDNTLIQTGTEQDVAANGTASYSAWWSSSRRRRSRSRASPCTRATTCTRRSQRSCRTRTCGTSRFRT